MEHGIEDQEVARAVGGFLEADYCHGVTCLQIVLENCARIRDPWEGPSFEVGDHWEESDHSTRMLEVNWRCSCAANFGIVVCAVVCEVFLDAVEEEVISLLLGAVLLGFEGFG